jgi:cholinesterase
MTKHQLLGSASRFPLGSAIATSVVTSVVTLASFVAAPVHAATFTGINSFGDSLVDTGNLFTVTSAFSSLGVPALPPSPPYAQRLSNGPILVDNLAQAFNLSPALISSLVLNPPLTPPTEGVNFAFAGAFSSQEHLLDDAIPPLAPFFPGFLEQVALFSFLTPQIPADPQALNIIAVGSNDYLAALNNPAGLGGLVNLPDQVTNNIVAGISQLASFGANNFLVVNLPALGNTPFATTLAQQSGLPIKDILNQLSLAHNFALEQKLASLSATVPGLKITTFDVFGLLATVTANPQTFGLQNVTDSCLTNFQPGFQFDGICNNPDQFLFWDDLHPTTTAYRTVSDAALATLAPPPPEAVPEPSLLLGLFAAGSALKLARRSEKTRV